MGTRLQKEMFIADNWDLRFLQSGRLFSRQGSPTFLVHTLAARALQVLVTAISLNACCLRQRSSMPRCPLDKSFVVVNYPHKGFWQMC